jgi:hypothetical protein
MYLNPLPFNAIKARSRSSLAAKWRLHGIPDSLSSLAVNGNPKFPSLVT